MNIWPVRARPLAGVAVQWDGETENQIAELTEVHEITPAGALVVTAGGGQMVAVERGWWVVRWAEPQEGIVVKSDDAFSLEVQRPTLA